MLLPLRRLVQAPPLPHMIKPNLTHELAAWSRGHRVVVGVDEVGRGAWAGPIVAAAVQLPRQSICYDQPIIDETSIQLPKLLRDSKKLSASQRLQLDNEIKPIASQIAIGLVEVEEINRIGIGPANFLAMSRSLDQLQLSPDFILIDGFKHPTIPAGQQQAIVKGDSQVASIAAASIIAKVHRDQLMEKLATQYPQYGFDQHKGYGTQAHQQAIAINGLSPLHRIGFNLKFLSR